MRKFIAPVICCLMLVGLIGCSGAAKGLGGESRVAGIIDYQTDVPMLVYAFLKIKPEASIPLSAFCDAASILQNKESIIALIEQKLRENKVDLLADEYTRRWLLSKAQSLIGISIDPEKITILAVDNSVTVERLREVISLICEGVKAHKGA